MSSGGLSDFLYVLALALLPAGGNIVGCLLAESVRTPKRLVGAALHAAAGIAIAVVSVDLVPRILDATPAWLMAATFLGGASFSVLLASGVDWLRAKVGTGTAGAWMVYAAVATDLASDGLMTGAGSAIAGALGLILGLSQVVANIPGGFAAAANFRDDGMPRAKRLLIAASFPIPTFLSAGLGFWLLQGTAESIQHAALAFMVGVLLLATVEDTVPQGDEPGPARWLSTSSFAAGFACFVLLSSYLR